MKATFWKKSSFCRILLLTVSSTSAVETFSELGAIVEGQIQGCKEPYVDESLDAEK